MFSQRDYVITGGNCAQAQMHLSSVNAGQRGSGEGDSGALAPCETAEPSKSTP